jgi:hypothetical protein
MHQTDTPSYRKLAIAQRFRDPTVPAAAVPSRPSVTEIEAAGAVIGASKSVAAVKAAAVYRRGLQDCGTIALRNPLREHDSINPVP